MKQKLWAFFRWAAVWSALQMGATLVHAVELRRAEVGNVSSASFALLVELDREADLDLRVYDAAEGGNDLGATLAYDWYPLDLGSVTIPGSRIEERQQRALVQQQMRARNLHLVTVLDALPGVSYFVELLVDDGGSTQVIGERIAVRTADRTAFVGESRQVLVDVSAHGVDLTGALIRMNQADAAYPLFAVVGDVSGAGRAYLNLTDFLSSDGSENAGFAADAVFECQLIGYHASPVQTTVPLQGGFTVASATTLPYAVGNILAGFVFNPIADQQANVPFTISIRAVDADGNMLPEFEDVAVLSGSPADPLQAGLTPAFVAGQLLDYPVTFASAGEYMLQVTLPDGTLASLSELFNVSGELTDGWQLTLLTDPENAGVVAGGGSFADNRIVPVRAQPQPGWRFLHWLGGGAVDPYAAETFIEMRSDHTLTAVFAPAAAPGSYPDWRAERFGADADNPLIAGLERDPNRNGLSNLMAYAFSMDPLATDGPRREPQFARADDQLLMTYHRRTNDANLRFVIERSVGLGAVWHPYVPDPASLQIEPVDADLERVSVPLPLPDTAAALFYRLRVDLEQGIRGPWQLALAAEPVDAGAVLGAGTYTDRSTVAVAASPEPGWRFVHWLGGGLSDPYARIASLNVLDDHQLTAVFAPADPPESYQQWSERLFAGVSIDPERTGMDSDPNQNGLSNLLEFAFGMHPLANDGPRREPQLTLLGTRLQLVYYRRTNAPGLSVLIEHGDGRPGIWQRFIPDPATLQLEAVEPGIERVTLLLPDTSASGDFRFFRVRVEIYR